METELTPEQVRRGVDYLLGGIAEMQDGVGRFSVENNEIGIPDRSKSW